MSLTDALLLDPHRDRKEIWIALRTDSQRGCGSIDDPFHGGTTSEPLVPGESYKYTVTTKVPHHRLPGDTLRINDVFYAGVRNPLFNTFFTVEQLGTPPDRTLLITLPTGSGPFTPNLFDFTAASAGINSVAITGDAGTCAVVEGNAVFEFAVGGPYHDTWSTRDLITRDNYYHNVLSGPTQNLGSVVPTGVPIALDSLASAPSGEANECVATATTRWGHGLIASRDTVVISGVVGPTATDALRYNGAFIVTETPDTLTFKCKITVAMGETLSSVAQPPPGADIGYLFFEPGLGALKIVESLDYEKIGTDFVATAKTIYPRHGLLPGDAVVIIRGGAPGYANSDFFNGYFTVIATPDARTFQYRLPGNPNPASDTGASDAGYFGRLSQTAHLINEGNVLALAVNGIVRAHGPAPLGIRFLQSILRLAPRDKGRSGPPFQFRKVIVRDNVISPAAPFSEPTEALALELFHCERALIQGNVVDLPVTQHFLEGNCGTVAYLSNISALGQPRMGAVAPGNLAAQRRIPDLAEAVEDSTLMALL